MRELECKLNKLLLVVLLIFTNVHAQTRDGSWLNSAIQANERVNLKTANDSETIDVLHFLGFLSGILAAQRDNTFQTQMLLFVFKDESDEKARIIRAVALRHSPLYNLPDKVDGAQVIAIVKKYIADNPKRWNESAYALIIDALKDAYPVKAQ